MKHYQNSDLQWTNMDQLILKFNGKVVNAIMSELVFAPKKVISKPNVQYYKISKSYLLSVSRVINYDCRSFEILTTVFQSLK